MVHTYIKNKKHKPMHSARYKENLQCACYKGRGLCMVHFYIDMIRYAHMKGTDHNLPKSSLSAPSSLELSSVSVVGIVSVVLLRVTVLGGSELFCPRRLDLLGGVADVLASAGCNMAFTTADTMSGMSAAVRGRVFNLFSSGPLGVSGFPLFFPVVVGVLVASDLGFAGGPFGRGFFLCCTVFATEFFMDDCGFCPLVFGGILIMLKNHLCNALKSLV